MRKGPTLTLDAHAVPAGRYMDVVYRRLWPWDIEWHQGRWMKTRKREARRDALRNDVSRWKHWRGMMR
ncbi:hypothetical protein GGC64_005933 [Mycobacterium sp. OAS707]|uniref:hypothetical protein n=1 Tax=Mycobacterium sp. OAS707 TaxID=2663822 RepID=UPI001789F48B|nr:hypothetical protein [Mycobacterium sp. OAS707]MBE1551846.1 hypothetical protein [Mycobacterium sp. OAS707]